MFVVGDDNKAERRTVKLGAWSGTEWIVESGLNVGERIIVEGLTKVQPDAVVRPIAARASDSAQSAG